MKNLCPTNGLPCKKDCILYRERGQEGKDAENVDYPAHCGKFGIKFPIQEI